MEKSQKRIAMLAVASALAGSLAAATGVLLRNGAVLDSFHAARPWLTAFFVASTVVLAGMLGAALSRQRKP